MWWKDTFFDSNLFVSTITFLVGGLAIYLYLKQRSDHKKDAASLIIQEVRYAEQQIQNAIKHDYNFYLADKLLPTNSWHRNINLFIKDLKESEIDLISSFYSHAAYLDIVISKISDMKNNILIPKGTTGSVSVPEGSQVKEFELSASKILKEVAEKITLIYNTPAVDRLRLISEKKFIF